MPIDPVTGWTLVKTVADAMKKLYEVANGVKDYETKQKLDEVLDELRDLKQQASSLEDENRLLREKLRFKSDAYEFRNPFYHVRANPQQPLCPKCFAKETAGPMSDKYQDGTTGMCFRRCLVCENILEAAW